MHLEIFDGTITFPATGFKSVEPIRLQAYLGDGSGSQVTIQQLADLQARYDGQLDICRDSLQDGHDGLHVRQHAVACCAESARLQAEDLARHLQDATGLRLRLAESRTGLGR